MNTQPADTDAETSKAAAQALVDDVEQSIHRIRNLDPGLVTSLVAKLDGIRACL